MGWKEGWCFFYLADGTVVDVRAHRQYRQHKLRACGYPEGLLRPAVTVIRYQSVSQLENIVSNGIQLTQRSLLIYLLIYLYLQYRVHTI